MPRSKRFHDHLSVFEVSYRKQRECHSREVPFTVHGHCQGGWKASGLENGKIQSLELEVPRLEGWDERGSPSHPILLNGVLPILKIYLHRDGSTSEVCNVVEQEKHE